MELNEDYADINEIDILAGDIIEYFTKSNLGFLKDFTEGLGTNVINLKVSNCVISSDITDIKKYDSLWRFLREFGLEISFVKYLNGALGIWKRIDENRGIIELKLDESKFIEKVKWYIQANNLNEKWSDTNAIQILRFIFNDFKSTLIHEIQHAYDDFRSGGRYRLDKKSKNYYSNLKYDANKEGSRQTDLERSKYYDLPHEYWARFSQYVNKWKPGFNQSFDKIFENFKMFFVGYDNLSENNKKRLQKALYKFWDEKNNNRIKENTMKLNKTELTEMIQKITKTLIKESKLPNVAVESLDSVESAKIYPSGPNSKQMIITFNDGSGVKIDGSLSANRVMPIKGSESGSYGYLLSRMYRDNSVYFGDLWELYKPLAKESDDWSKTNFKDQPLDEATYELDSTDPQLQTKSNKLQSDSTLFNKDTDEIKISNPNDTTNESKSFTKNQIVEMMMEAKAIRDKNGDYVKAIKKADRETEMDDKGPGFKSKDKAHKNDKKYNRKSFTKDELTEATIEPIGKLGTGAKIYFNQNGLRVNDSKDGVILNITKEGSTMADANIPFKTAKEAVDVAKVLSRMYPNGVKDAVIVDDRLIDFAKSKIMGESKRKSFTKNELIEMLTRK